MKYGTRIWRKKSSWILIKLSRFLEKRTRASSRKDFLNSRVNIGEWVSDKKGKPSEGCAQIPLGSQ